MVSVGSVTLDVKLNLQGFKRQVAAVNQQVSRSLDDINVSIDLAGVGEFKQELSSLGNFAAGIGQGVGQQFTASLQNALSSAASTITETVIKSLDVSGAFESAQVAVSTLTGDASEFAAEMRQLTKELDFQKNSVELLEASYDVASAGFDEAGEASKILGASTRGAIGGFSDLATVSDAATSVLNAYGLEADQASSVIDKFIQTQNAGKIVVDQFASQIGRLAPIAAQAGISLDELNGFIAQATVQGVPVESTFSGIRQAISAVLKPAEQASQLAEELGIQFNAAALRSGGLVGIIEELNKRGLDTADNLTVLFGSVEAVAALAPSTGAKFGELTNKIQASADSLGVAEEAFRKVAETGAAQTQRLANLANEALLQIGQPLDRVKGAVLATLNDLLQGAIAASEEGIGRLNTATIDLTETLRNEDFSAIFAELNTQVQEITSLLVDQLAGAIAEITELIRENPEAISRLVTGLGEATKNAINLASGVGKVVGFFVDLGLQIDKIFNQIKELIPFGEQLFGALNKGITTFLPGLQSANDLLGSLTQLGASGGASIAESLSGAGGGGVDLPDFTKLINEQTESIKKQGETAVATANKVSKEQEKAAKEALSQLKQANADAESEIKRSQNARIAAIQQAVLDGVKSEEQAAADIAKIEQDTISATIAAKRVELAKIQEFAQGRTKAAQQAAAQEAKIVEEISALNLQKIEAEIEARKKLAEEQKRLAIEAINAQFSAVGSRLQGQESQLSGQAGGLQGQLDLLSAQANLQGALNTLEQEKLNTQIAQAQANQDDIGAEQLKLQLVELQGKQERQQFEVAQQQLQLKQELAAIEAQRQLISAQIAENEAAQALALAQANNESANEIALKQQALELQRQNVSAAEELISRQEKLNQIEKDTLAATQKSTVERQKQARISQEAATANAGFGDLAGSGGSLGGSLSSRGGGGRLRANTGSSGNQNAFTAFSDRISGGLSELTNRTINNQVNQAANLLNDLARRSESFFGIGNLQPNLGNIPQLAAGVSGGGNFNPRMESNAMLQRIDKLTNAIANQKPNQTLIAQSPNPVQDLARMQYEQAKRQARALGL